MKPGTSHFPGPACRGAVRQRELAAEMPGRLGALHPLSEQTVRGVEQLRLLGLGGPRHSA